MIPRTYNLYLLEIIICFDTWNIMFVVRPVINERNVFSKILWKKIDESFSFNYFDKL